MACEVKWIKLATALPDNRKIKQIRKLPDGDAIALLWVFLMCLAGEMNDSGMVYFTPEIPYTDEMLAEQFDMEVNTVRLGLQTFERFGMVEIIDNIICLPSWEKWQAEDKLSSMREKTRKRVAKHREKQRALIGQSQCQYCGGTATGYDHIVALARGGTDTEANKVPCCVECNRIKNDKPLVDFLNSNRERINDGLIAQSPKLCAFVTLCNVTGRYIVTDGNAIEKKENREEKEERREEEKKSVRETTHTLFTRLLPDYNLPPALQAKMGEWIKYKTERKEPYKEQGMKSLLRQIETSAMQYGAQALCSLIDECMANNWKGIILDRLKQGKPAGQPAQTARRSSNPFLDMMNEEAGCEYEPGRVIADDGYFEGGVS